MWIKTEDGDFVNLNHVHSVYVEDDHKELSDPNVFEIIAEHDNEDYQALLFSSNNRYKIKLWMEMFERTLKQYNATIIDITSEMK